MSGMTLEENLAQLDWLSSAIQHDRDAAERMSPDCRLYAREDGHVEELGGDQVPDGAWTWIYSSRDVIARCDAELRIISRCRDQVAYLQGRPASGYRENLNLGYEIGHLVGVAMLLLYGYRHRPGFKDEWLPDLA